MNCERGSARIWKGQPHSGRDKLRLGICWFKTGSTEHISRIWEMVNILERNGIYVKKIRTDRPGYVIYEDEWQLCSRALPQRHNAEKIRNFVTTANRQ